MGVGGCVQEMGLPRTTTLPYLDPGVPVSQWERQEPARAVCVLSWGSHFGYLGGISS